jgi:hypothetical protein
MVAIAQQVHAVGKALIGIGGMAVNRMSLAYGVRYNFSTTEARFQKREPVSDAQQSI